MQHSLEISVIGTGYVGLVSGACIADLGFQVTCLDIDAAKIDTLNHGDIPIFEPGLDKVVARAVSAGNLNFSLVCPKALNSADMVFLAVGTPTKAEDGAADLSYLFQAAKDIAPHLKDGVVVVVKSTVPVGTNRRVQRLLKAERPDLKFSVVSNPEFLREGHAVYDFQNPDRIVAGYDVASREIAAPIIQTLYQKFTKQGFDLFECSLEDAELIKYASNAFLATKVAFINEVANLCEKTGADIGTISTGMGLDDRIGPKFLQAGPGYGGSCFPKDTLAMSVMGKRFGARQSIIETVIDSNEARKLHMANRIQDLAGTVLGRKVAIWGVAFKADTDDVRESPALAVIKRLQELGALVQAYDPEGMENAARLVDDVEWKSDAVAALEGADILVILTEWDAFKSVDIAEIRAQMSAVVIFDYRNLRPDLRGHPNVRYIGVGE